MLFAKVGFDKAENGPSDLPNFGLPTLPPAHPAGQGNSGCGPEARKLSLLGAVVNMRVRLATGVEVKPLQRTGVEGQNKFME